jgi:hypothetical protein
VRRFIPVIFYWTNFILKAKITNQLEQNYAVSVTIVLDFLIALRRCFDKFNVGCLNKNDLVGSFNLNT